MDESIESLFREAAYNCVLCYEFSKNNPNKENPHTVFAQKPLKSIIDSQNKENEDYMKAQGAIDECNECGFRDTKIKNYAEYLGISLY